MITQYLEADGPIPWVRSKSSSVNISADSKPSSNGLGGGTVHLEKLRVFDGAETAVPFWMDGSEVTFTDDFSYRVQVGKGEIIRLRLSGSTSPSAVLSITDCQKVS